MPSNLIPDQSGPSAGRAAVEPGQTDPQPDTVASRPWSLSEADAKALATAVKVGFVEAAQATRPPEMSSRQRVLLWVLVGIFGAVAGALGVVGFTSRPPQKTTYVALLAEDTLVRIGQTASGSSITTLADGILLETGARSPVRVDLPLVPGGCESLAERLGVSCAAGAIAAGGSPVTMRFSHPYSVTYAPGPLQEMTLRSNPQDSNGTDMQVTARRSAVDPAPVMHFAVTPGAGRVAVSRGGRELGEWALTDGVHTGVLFSTPPSQDPAAFGTARFLYGGEKITFSAAFRPGTVHVENTPEGVLALGPDTFQLGRGERLQLRIDPGSGVPLPGASADSGAPFVLVRAGILTVDARDCEHSGDPKTPLTRSQEPCVTGALRNGVVELVPVWYSSWNEWFRTMWIAFAGGTVVTLFLEELKRRRLWPS